MPYYPEQTVSRYYYFKDKDGSALDPDTFTYEIFDPSGTSMDSGSLTKVEDGKYQLDYNVPASPTAGDWTIQIEGGITAGSYKGIKLFKFRVEDLP